MREQVRYEGVLVWSSWAWCWWMESRLLWKEYNGEGEGNVPMGVARDERLVTQGVSFRTGTIDIWRKSLIEESTSFR